jgi:hypothetical protein
MAAGRGQLGARGPQRPGNRVRGISVATCTNTIQVWCCPGGYAEAGDQTHEGGLPTVGQLNHITDAAFETEIKGETQFGVTGIPTMILFKDGQMVERIVGFMPKPALMKKIEPHLQATASGTSA